MRFFTKLMTVLTVLLTLAIVFGSLALTCVVGYELYMTGASGVMQNFGHLVHIFIQSASGK